MTIACLDRIASRAASLDDSVHPAHNVLANEETAKRPRVAECAMRHAVLHHPRHREKGHISHRHGNLRVGTLRKIYGQSFAAGQSHDATLYELLELPGSYRVSDLHLTMLQQDYDDGLLERKIKKVICRK
jgi:hypothetical protein